jgi:WD40 repeat protein
VAGGHPLIRLYDVAGKSADPLVAYEGHTSNVTAVGWQRDGRWLFSGSEDGSVRIWDPRASGSQRDYDARAAVHSVCLHPNQAELISADHSGTLRVWDLAAGKCAAELCPEVDSPLSSVGIAADASIVVAANFNGSVFCWRPRAGDEHEFVPLKRLNVSFGAGSAAGRAVKKHRSARGHRPERNAHKDGEDKPALHRGLYHGEARGGDGRVRRSSQRQHNAPGGPRKRRRLE